MKKIAFIIRIFQEKAFHGGGEKLFYNLIKRFLQDGYAVDVYCSTSDVKSVEYLNKIVVIDEYYDHNIPETMENFYEKVKKLTEQQNYEFIISENITPPIDITFLQGHSLINRLKKTKNPLEAFLYNFRKIKKQRIKYQKKWLKQGYRKIFVVSDILKQDLINNFNIPKQKISVVYPGIDIKEEKSNKIANKIPTFGLLAPGFKIKGGFVFLKALKILKEKGYKFKAKIVYPKFNKNWGVKFLLNFYQIYDEVEFLPYQQNVANFYKSIDCLAVPSIEDTFNLAALEAMACRTPVIISKNAGACEIIEEKVNGLTFEINQNSAKNLAEKMIYFMDNPQNHANLSISAFNTAQKYSWDRTYESFIAELKKC